MKKQLNRYDIIACFLVLCLLFTVGIHIGGGSSEATPIAHAEIKLKAEKVKGVLLPSDILEYEGRFRLRVVSHDGEFLTLTAPGYFTERGFLLFGVKYLSRYQPMSLVGEETFVYARISELYQSDKITPENA